MVVVVADVVIVVVVAATATATFAVVVTVAAAVVVVFYCHLRQNVKKIIQMSFTTLRHIFFFICLRNTSNTL